jgi:hypothetical protein
VLRAGCAWRMLPEGFPPVSTVYRWFARFRYGGTWETINHHLVMRDRERVGRAASPSVAVLDSQSARTAEAGGPRLYDAGAPSPCSRHPAAASRSSSASLPTAPMPGSGWRRRRGSSSRSCASQPARSALPSGRGAGWWKGSSPGAAGTEGSRGTSKRPALPRKHSSTPPRQGSRSDASAVAKQIRNGLLEVRHDKYISDIFVS